MNVVVFYILGLAVAGSWIGIRIWRCGVESAVPMVLGMLSGGLLVTFGGGALSTVMWGGLIGLVIGRLAGGKFAPAETAPQATTPSAPLPAPTRRAA